MKRHFYLYQNPHGHWEVMETGVGCVAYVTGEDNLEALEPEEMGQLIVNALNAFTN